MSRVPPEIQRFRGAALRFCRVIDEAATLGHREFLEATAASLADLYRAGFSTSMRRMWSEDTLESLAESRLPPYEDVAGRLAKALGRNDAYWQLHEPTEDEAPLQQVLSDDLADIYLDVLEGLVALDAGAHAGDVEWQWRFGFENHWGPHAVTALRALHYLLYAH